MEISQEIYDKQNLRRYTWYINKKNYIYVNMYWKDNYEAKVLYIKFYEHGIKNHLKKDYGF